MPPEQPTPFFHPNYGTPKGPLPYFPLTSGYTVEGEIPNVQFNRMFAYAYMVISTVAFSVGIVTSQLVPIC